MSKIKFSYDDRTLDMKYSDLTTRAIITSDVHLDFFSNAGNADAIAALDEDGKIQDNKGNMYLGIICAEYAKICDEKSIDRDGSDIAHLASLLVDEFAEPDLDDSQWKVWGSELAELDKENDTAKLARDSRATQSKKVQLKLYHAVSNHLGENIWTCQENENGNVKGDIRFVPDDTFIDTIQKYWKGYKSTIQSASRIVNPCFSAFHEKSLETGHLFTNYTTVASNIYATSKDLCDDIDESKLAFSEMMDCMYQLTTAKDKSKKEREKSYKSFENAVKKSEYWTHTNIPKDWHKGKDQNQRIIAGLLADPEPDPEPDNGHFDYDKLMLTVPDVNLEKLSGTDAIDKLELIDDTIVNLHSHLDFLQFIRPQLASQTAIDPAEEEAQSMADILGVDIEKARMFVALQNKKRQVTIGTGNQATLESGADNG